MHTCRQGQKLPGLCNQCHEVMKILQIPSHFIFCCVLSKDEKTVPHTAQRQEYGHEEAKGWGITLWFLSDCTNILIIVRSAEIYKNNSIIFMGTMLIV